MNEHRTVARIIAGIVVVSGLFVGATAPAQAQDSGWNGTRLIANADSGWNGTR